MVFLKDSEQLQGNRYRQNDDTQGSNVAVGTIHPLSWIWNITDNKTELNSHKLFENRLFFTIHRIDTKFVDQKLILKF